MDFSDCIFKFQQNILNILRPEGKKSVLRTKSKLKLFKCPHDFSTGGSKSFIYFYNVLIFPEHNWLLSTTVQELPPKKFESCPTKENQQQTRKDIWKNEL